MSPTTVRAAVMRTVCVDRSTPNGAIRPTIVVANAAAVTGNFSLTRSCKRARTFIVGSLNVAVVGWADDVRDQPLVAGALENAAAVVLAAAVSW